MLLMSFDDALTRANFSFVYFLQFYLLKIFDTFQWGLSPPTPPLWLRHCIQLPSVAYPKKSAFCVALYHDQLTPKALMYGMC